MTAVADFVSIDLCSSSDAMIDSLLPMRRQVANAMPRKIPSWVRASGMLR